MNSEVSAFTTERLRSDALKGRRLSNVTLYAGVVLFGGIVLISLLAPLIVHDPNRIDLNSILSAPSRSHLMGTDEFGRDLFSRVLYGTRLDIEVVLVITYGPLCVGVLLGSIAGYFGGWVDMFVRVAVDIVMAFPFLVLVVAIVAITGPGVAGVFIGVSIVAWALYARLTRGEMLVLREQPFILAARGLGYSNARIIFRHALPNVIRTSLVFSMIDLVLNLLFLAGLSYLGLGVQPPTAELGVAISDGRAFLGTAWWYTTLPGVVLVLLGVGACLIGDGLADRLGTGLPRLE
jgi:peptide/nickel transport system permease protein